MVNEIGNFNIQTTLKQLQDTPFIKESNKAVSSENSPGKILDGFANILQNHLDETNEKQIDANKAEEIFATGGKMSVHEVMIKAGKAEMAMELTIQMRNKLVSAYKEMQNMHV